MNTGKAKTNFAFTIAFIIIITFNIFLIIKGKAVEKYYLKERADYLKKYENSNLLFIRDLDLLSQEISINFDSAYNDIRQKTSTRLIYAYSGDECSKCIFEDITLLKGKIKKHESLNVIVFPVMENTRNVNISLKADLTGINFKRLDKGCIKFPHHNGSSVRFFAILTSDGRITLPFFPDMAYPERTDAYLDVVFAKYFNSSNNIKKKEYKE